MEEDIKEIIKVFKGLEFETYEWDVYYDGKLQINCDTMNTYLENILNELERLQKENELLESTKDTCPEMATSGFRCHLKNALNFEKTVHTCLHCGNDTPLYCENCYQELISKNAELQLEIEELKQDNSKQWKERCKLSFEVDDSIPKQVIRDKIQLLEKEIKLLDKNDKHTLIENDYIISVLKEILGE